VGGEASLSPGARRQGMNHRRKSTNRKKKKKTRKKIGGEEIPSGLKGAKSLNLKKRDPSAYRIAGEKMQGGIGPRSGNAGPGRKKGKRGKEPIKRNFGKCRKKEKERKIKNNCHDWTISTYNPKKEKKASRKRGRPGEVEKKKP